MTTQPHKRIPYALADYRRMREENAYYVDKTRFIPLIEAAPYYLFCIRPRRFGKTLWLTLLDYYYDINEKENFDVLFGDTYIGQQPTADRNSYLTLTFNFANVDPDLTRLRDSFEQYGAVMIENFMQRYQTFFSAEEQQTVAASETTDQKLRRVFAYSAYKRYKLYLFIDEYDNFANTILTQHGEHAYRELTHGSGFFRYFFNLLKGATTGRAGGLARLFITGVSPIVMDDVSSGFNIGTNITLDARFNEMLGFTEEEVRIMLAYYRDSGAFPLDVAESLVLMREWYGNYHFSRTADTPIYNSDMVLYFVENSINQQVWPENLIDPNIRIDYGKLRHLMHVDKRLNGNFSQLQSIIETGEVTSNVVLSFPLERMLQRENFISLLVYFGLLTFAGEQGGLPLLRIPNLSIKDLLYGFIRDGFRDVNIFRVDPWRLSNLLSDMAYLGEWKPFFDFLAVAVKEQTSIRDYLSGEKVIQGFLLSYLNVSNFFLTWPEHEMGGGFVDFYLEPFLARYPDMRFGYLVELKYIARSEYSPEKLKEKLAEAATQFKKYANDERIRKVADQVPLHCLLLVYSGWELVYREAWPADHHVA
jgi:Predicted AAA-ATPase/PD-(D/E)XK nuclease superfamily